MRRLLALFATCVLIVGTVSASPRLTDERLQGWFDFWNTTLWEGKLPPTSVRWGDLTAQNDMGHTLCHSTDEGWRCSIVIDRDTNPVERSAKFTLLHEMCHVAVDTSSASEFDEHGPKFQACMLQLGKDGVLKDLW
jgi:hypothetical protein